MRPDRSDPRNSNGDQWHFLTEDDYEAHNCLCAISTGKRADDESRMIYPPGVFLKSPDQMRSLFPEAAEACDNTLAVAQIGKIVADENCKIKVH